MARYCGDKNSINLINVVNNFKEICLLNGGSLFTDGSIWKQEYCKELIVHFVENLDEGDGDFFEKLETQLMDASPQAKALASEMLWFMFLCPSNIGPTSKRNSIERVFSWSHFELSSSTKDQYFSDLVLTGIGSAGTAYNTGRWRELVYMIRITNALCLLSKDEKKSLLNDYLQFSEWLEAIPENENRQLRHMWLYLFFPDEHERIFGNTDRREVLTKLTNVDSRKYRHMRSKEIDAGLFELRKQLEAEYGTQELDYYVEPLRSKWKQPKAALTGEIKESGQEYDVKPNDVNQALNQILYGPPGTGKTYTTINKALQIVAPDFYLENKDDREKLKGRFDELLNNNRIGFVTFHQSFSYEDFVEGLKADSENGALNYTVEPGVFKAICERAGSSSNTVVSVDEFETSLLKLQESSEESEERLVLTTIRGKRFEIEYSGGGTFKVFPDSTENADPKYVASIANVRKLYLTGSKQGIYNSSYVEGFLLYLKKQCGLKEYTEQTNIKNQNAKPFVLIIDEINRGNISNIFGELITLIEPSKRSGGTESLSVKLPYSKETFSVPSNLHIIGTMNTADKSLAQLDIALRRRFEFVEMMTNYELLKEIPDIEGINVAKLVKTMNQRIELLYDREHTIGHSFFLPLLGNPSLQLLAEIFELQLLPLLEEYFFEDWERVGQVLGDHLKDNHELRFVIEQFGNSEIAELMGDDWEVQGIQPYCRNQEAFKNPQAYIGVYTR